MRTGKRNMSEALASYGKAIEMSLSGTEEKAALFSNRAACYLMQSMYRHAIAEFHALHRLDQARCPPRRAYEQMHQYDRAVPISRLPPRLTRTATTSARSSATRAARAPQGVSISRGPGGGLRAGQARRSASPRRSSRRPRPPRPARARASCPR